MHLLLLGLPRRLPRPRTFPAGRCTSRLLAAAPTLALVPFAVPAAERAGLREALAGRLARPVVDLGAVADPAAALTECSAVVVPAGDITALVLELQLRALVEPIQRRVVTGAPYLGWGAGAEVASPAVVLPGLGEEPALHLVPFHVVPITGERLVAHAHLSNHPAAHRREWVVGVAPEAGVRVHDRDVAVVGDGPVVLFRGGRQDQAVGRGARVPALLDEPSLGRSRLRVRCGRGRPVAP